MIWVWDASTDVVYINWMPKCEAKLPASSGHGNVIDVSIYRLPYSFMFMLSLFETRMVLMK